MSDPGSTEPHITDVEPPEDLEPAAADQAVHQLIQAGSAGPDGVTVVPASAWNGFVAHNDLKPSTAGSELEVEFKGRKFRQGKPQA